MPKYYLWTEDTKAGLEFWKIISELRYNGSLLVRDDKHSNNNKLVADVLDLNPGNDVYFIAIDYVADNNYVRQCYEMILQKLKAEPNIRLLPLLCFEDLVLSFPLVCEWAHIKGTKREILFKDVLSSISNFSIRFDKLNTAEGKQFIQSFNLNKLHSTEVILKSLANQVLQANDWSLKSYFGRCWYTDCCTPALDGKKVRRNWCSDIPEVGAAKMQMLINSPKIMKVLEPIDRMLEPELSPLSKIPNFTQTATVKMECFEKYYIV